MKKLIIYLFILAPCYLQAQAPGYQGKHFLLSYNMGLSSNAIQAFTGLEQKVPFELYLTHSFDAEYVLSRKFSLEGEFTFLENKPSSLAPYYTPFIMNQTGFGLNCVFYPGEENGVAPVGDFLKLRFGVRNYSSTGIVEGNDSITGQPYVAQRSATGSGYNFGLEFGHHQIIKDRILFSASICLEATLLHPDNPLSYDDLSVNGEAQEFLLSHYWGYFKIGIGGLLF
jgi:hypothetical protein